MRRIQLFSLKLVLLSSTMRQNYLWSINVGPPYWSLAFYSKIFLCTRKYGWIWSSGQFSRPVGMGEGRKIIQVPWFFFHDYFSRSLLPVLAWKYHGNFPKKWCQTLGWWRKDLTPLCRSRLALKRISFREKSLKIWWPTAASRVILLVRFWGDPFLSSVHRVYLLELGWDM